MLEDEAEGDRVEACVSSGIRRACRCAVDAAGRATATAASLGRSPPPTSPATAALRETRPHRSRCRGASGAVRKSEMPDVHIGHSRYRGAAERRTAPRRRRAALYPYREFRYPFRNARRSRRQAGCRFRLGLGGPLVVRPIRKRSGLTGGPRIEIRTRAAPHERAIQRPGALRYVRSVRCWYSRPRRVLPHAGQLPTRSSPSGGQSPTRSDASLRPRTKRIAPAGERRDCMGTLDPPEKSRDHVGRRSRKLHVCDERPHR